MQPGRLPPRVGRPGDESRGGEPRHFPFPSTCPTSAPGLGLRPRAASEPERQNHALRSPRVGKWGAGGGAGHPAGTSSPPHARPFAPPQHTLRLKQGEESHTEHERNRWLSDPNSALLDPPLPGAGGWPRKVAPFFPRGQCGVCGCPARFRLPRAGRGSPENCRPAPPSSSSFPSSPTCPPGAQRPDPSTPRHLPPPASPASPAAWRRAKLRQRLGALPR